MRDLPEGWSLKRVDEAGEVQIGRQLSPSQLHGRHMRPYLRVANVHDGRIDFSDVLEMNFSPSEFGTFSLRPGDVLLNEGQSLELVGRSAIYDGPPGTCFQNTLIRFRPREVLPALARVTFKRWLDTGEFAKIARQTTSIAHLGTERFAAMMLPIPPMLEQQRIVEILGAVDEQIALFGSVLAKAEARERGLIEGALSGIGVPSGPLSANLAVRPNNGYSPVEADGWTGVRALGLGCLTRQGFKPVQLKDVPGRDGRNIAAMLSDGDLLMSRANTRDLVGLAGVYRDIGTPCIYPDLMMRLTVNSSCIAEFLELVLRSSRVRRQIQAHAQGTSESMVKISSSIVLGLQVQIPELAVQREVLSVVLALKRETELVRTELRKSQELRRGLVEDLLTGRVQV